MARAQGGAEPNERTKDMEYSDLTEAQKAKARECKTTDELLALAKEEGVELTDAQL